MTVTNRDHWVGTWATAAQPALGEPATYESQTLRLIVRTSVAGDAVRVRVSNAFGSRPLEIGALRVARRADGATVQAGTDRVLTVGARGSFSVAPGADVWTDPADLQVPALSDLAVSIHLPEPTRAETDHVLALQTSYVSSAHGDVGSALELSGATTITSWPFVTGVDVRRPPPATAIVALGDSIVDGAASTLDTNRRWPDLLAARLRASAGRDHLGVLNAGIIGNRLLFESPEGRPFHGAAAVARLDRDVLAQTGVGYVIVLVGLNDIGFPSSVTPASEHVSADRLIEGYRRVIERARGHGCQVIGGTITPFKGAISAEGFYSAEKDRVRQEVNEWIRTAAAFDGVIDFDGALRAPADRSVLSPSLDSGDRIHPNDAGHQAMADAIDLTLFQAAG